jgi:hypothetical protein
MMTFSVASYSYLYYSVHNLLIFGANNFKMWKLEILTKINTNDFAQ